MATVLDSTEQNETRKPEHSHSRSRENLNLAAMAENLEPLVATQNAPQIVGSDGNMAFTPPAAFQQENVAGLVASTGGASSGSGSEVSPPWSAQSDLPAAALLTNSLGGMEVGNPTSILTASAASMLTPEQSFQNDLQYMAQDMQYLSGDLQAIQAGDSNALSMYLEDRQLVLLLD